MIFISDLDRDILGISCLLPHRLFMSNSLMKYILVFSFFLPFSVLAEITLDGTLGRSGVLNGPDYQINATLGQQHGDHLFHSFKDFNLESHESATFSGTEGIQSIISRVTGGNPSHIDGILRSTIAGAELFFLNPYGIFFGPQAQLDLQGGFHASTADYLRLGKTGRFDARSPARSVLTTAPPTAFGFLEPPTAVEVQGSELAITPAADFSLVGGDLTLKNTQLTATSGHLNLVSVASRGEVTAQASQMDVRIPDTSSFTELGTITMITSHVETTGSPAGGISIRGGQFWMHNAMIHAHNLGDEIGEGIDVLATEGIHIQGDTLSTQSAEELFGIASNTFGQGRAGAIAITTPYLEMTRSAIDTSTRSEGMGGDITIQSQKIRLNAGAGILSNTYSTGKGGKINVKATEKVELIDHRVFPTTEAIENRTVIQTNTFGKGEGGHITIETGYLGLSSGYILSNTEDQGYSGTILVNTDFLDILNGGAIVAGIFTESTGYSGKITLNVTDTLKLSGFRRGVIQAGYLVIDNVQSVLGPITLGEGQGGLLEVTAKNLIVSDYAAVGAATLAAGHAGHMIITVDNLYLKDGGSLTNSSGTMVGKNLIFGAGNGGDIKVIAKKDIIISGRSLFNPSGITSNTFLSGHGGSINIQANRLILSDGGTIAVNSLGSGNAGNIHITANDISLINGGKITSAAAQAIGGHTTLSATDLFYLQTGQVTTSALVGGGNSGDITIEGPAFVVLNQSQIKAQADKGMGGNIRVIADHFLRTPDSILSASSRLGIDGTTLISSPSTILNSHLSSLSLIFMDASGLLPQPCDQIDFETYLRRSRFTVIPIDNWASPYDFYVSTYQPY